MVFVEMFNFCKKKRAEIRKRQQMNDIKKAGTGFATGLLIGGGSALLFAPKSGKETRKDIEKAYEDKKAKVEKTYNKTAEKVNKTKTKVIETAKDKVDEMADKALEKTGDALKKTEEKLEKAEKKVEKS